MAVTTYELIIRILGCFIAMSAYFFFLFGDHYLYTFAQALGVGGLAAYSVFSAYDSLMKSCITQVAAGRLTLAIPFILALLVFFRLTAYRWLSRYPMAILAGGGIGVVISLQVKSELIGGMTSTLSDIMLGNPSGTTYGIYSAWLMLVMFSFVIVYFMYSAKFAGPFHTGALRWVAKLGRWTFYISCGYLFGYIFFYNGIDLAAEMIISTFGRTFTLVKMALGIV